MSSKFSFTPAAEILGTDCQIRKVTLNDSPNLPNGDYTFIDTYCTDNTCDCRKTIIQIFHNQKLVSIVNFGWESPKFYLRWLGNPRDREFANEMSGLSIDPSSPDAVSDEGILALVSNLLDEKWIAILKDHYRLVRKSSKPTNIIRLSPKISRNAPCSCGSGKKFKNCCL